MDSCPDLYPLTSLQIGYVTSHLSRAFLYFAPVSHRFLILVDNESWWKNNINSSSDCIKEFMNTKYRMSPFRNNRSLLKSPSLGCRSSSHENKNLHKWLPAMNMASCLRKKAACSMMNLYEALHGFILFEIAWKDVRGINYLNDLQRDASFALEVKTLRRWEFNGIDQALGCITSWFKGTESETRTLQSNLALLQDKVPSNWSRGITVASKELLFNDASQAELFSEDVFFDVRECPVDTKDILNKEALVGDSMHEKMDSNIESTECIDTFLLFRFNDRDLPFKLQQIITSDLQLLPLVEAGLPSWVIFLQSYPLFCKAYCPWMPPLFGTFYILVSLITVVIGFYDLYKNVPLLKAAASHVCGPFFKWIEAWDGISRIRYLGTILFLQNLEKTIKWFLAMMRVMKLPISLLVEPLMYMLGEIMEFVTPMWSIAWVLLRSLWSMIGDFVEVLLSPFKLLYSCISRLVSLMCPFFHSIWKLFVFPTRGCLALANHVAPLFSGIYQVLERAFITITSSTSHLTVVTQIKSDSSHISLWRSLWNDLFSQVFKSLRNIIHGLVAFITSCNQYRHSICSHLGAIFWWLCCLLRLAPRAGSCRQIPQEEIRLKDGVQEWGDSKQE